MKAKVGIESTGLENWAGSDVAGVKLMTAAVEAAAAVSISCHFRAQCRAGQRSWMPKSSI